MKRFKLFGVGVLAVCALSLVALPVSAASAKKAKDVLQFDDGENAAPKEAPGMIRILIGTCEVQSDGHLTGNDAASVTLNAPSGGSLGCNEAYSESGILTSATLSTKKKLTLTGTIDITTPGPCTYAFSKWKGATVAIPGLTFSEFKDTAKLDKAAKNGSKCGKALTEDVLVGLIYQINEEETEPFSAVLVT